MVDPSVKSEDQLTFDGKSNSPAFSYDGTRIIYYNYLNNKYQPEIWMMNIDKTNRIKLTSEGGVSPVWLYQVLDAPLPANTPTASMAATWTLGSRSCIRNSRRGAADSSRIFSSATTVS